MAHVQIKKNPETGLMQLHVDGVDMSMHVAAEGFGIELSDAPPYDRLVVSMRVIATDWDIDWPESVIEMLPHNPDDPHAEVTIADLLKVYNETRYLREPGVARRMCQPESA